MELLSVLIVHAIIYKNKEVAVIGGGNSGVEAAIDLAGVCSKVTVFEFMDTLKADTVLQEKAKACPMWILLLILKR